MAVESDLLEGDGGDGEKHAQAVGGEEEKGGEPEVYAPEGEGDGQPQQSQRFDDRGEEFDEDEVGQDDHPEGAVAGIEEDALVTPEGVGEPAVPAVALPAEDAQAFGDFGPGDGIGDERDAAGPALLVAGAAQAQDKFHVLADGVRGVTAGGDDRPAVERPKAPEMMRLPPKRFQPMRPKRKARRYSITCMPGRNEPGTRTSSTRPLLTREAFMGRIVPPAATRSGRSRNGRTMRWRASGSMTVSASMAQTRRLVAMLRAALRASALPPFSLSTTSRLGKVWER